MAGAPDVTRLQRARDSFSGYNIHMIALSVPASLLRGNSDVIGVNGVTLKNQNLSINPMDGTITGTGPLVQIDRMATPVLNTVFIPFPRKNEYNSSTPQDDANGRFAADIVSIAQRLGVTQTNIDIFANLAIVRGDYLRLNLTTPNSSLGDGEDVTAPGFAGFPNGRRPGDDTIDTALFFVTNQATPRIGDGVPANDRRFLSTFPFFAPPHQPLENPQVDNTQN
jgi:hypothetical protein